MAKAARAQLEGTGIRTTDHFRGLYLKGRLSLSSLTESLENLPEGLTEARAVREPPLRGIAGDSGRGGFQTRPY
jgi:hypothetical protein